MLKETILVLLVTLTLSSVMMAQERLQPFMDQYQWENRVVLIFAPNKMHPRYLNQIDEFEGDKNGFTDRDLLIFHLFKEAGSYQGTQVIDSVLRDQFYESFDVAKGNFAVILIGKDGTEKLRQSSPLETDTLFSVIDAMPMRQREMRKEQ